MRHHESKEIVLHKQDMFSLMVFPPAKHAKFWLSIYNVILFNLHTKQNKVAISVVTSFHPIPLENKSHSVKSQFCCTLYSCYIKYLPPSLNSPWLPQSL